MTGYWDAGYTYWAAGNKGSSASSVSIAPVLVYEFSGDTFKPYIEAGIGIVGFSSIHAGEQDLGSSFNFEDRIGFGLKFGEGQKVGLRAIHYSNAGIKEPNDGIESFSAFTVTNCDVAVGSRGRVAAPSVRDPKRARISPCDVSC